MAFLFSEAGRRCLAELVRPRMLCLFDFDGTLVPIASQPDHVHLRHGTLERLMALQRLAPVGIVTGRSVADARARMEFVPDFFIGNHGLEGVPGWESHALDYEAQARGWKSELERRLAENHVDSGIWLEDKRYTLSLHYRAARHRSHAEKQVQELVRGLLPEPRLIGGKCVLNVVPEGAPNKGSAVEELMRGTGTESAIYVGDDHTDEDVFSLRDERLLTVRIGHAAHTGARFYLNERSEMAALLDELIVRLRRATSETARGLSGLARETTRNPA
jgi:trehalose 6-phosphate phosphatase